MFSIKKKTTPCTPGHFRCMKHLWLSPGIGRKRKKIMKAIREGTETGDVHVLILPSGGSQQLEAVRADYLIQSWYREQPITIVGLAESKEETRLLILRMMQECVNRRHDANLRAYLETWIGEEGLEE